MDAYLQTGQITCHDTNGRRIDCTGSGQDAEFRNGVSWPAERFVVGEETVVDDLTGPVWAKNANMAEFPVAWQEALDYIAAMNRDHVFGFSDWRLSNRRELRSLMSYQTRKPALPERHPFANLFSGWYWTSTTAAINTAYAWCVHMEGARMFYGHKEQFFLLRPVRGKGNTILPATGQTRCYDAKGEIIPCAGSGQDGELRSGLPWPEPRFEATGSGVIDRLTHLCWHASADLTGRPATWEEAFEAVVELNRRSGESASWRLPNIGEHFSLWAVCHLPSRG